MSEKESKRIRHRIELVWRLISRQGRKSTSKSCTAESSKQDEKTIPESFTSKATDKNKSTASNTPGKHAEEEENATIASSAAENSDEEDYSTSASSPPNSRSTYAYSQEGYDTFQHKVQSLAHSLGEFEDVTLQRQRGGGYNRVVVVRFRKRDGESFAGIFRIPRFTHVVGNSDSYDTQSLEWEILDQVAILENLCQRRIPVPKLLAFDATGENAIGLPFTLLEYYETIPLSTLYDNMLLEEKLSVVDSLVAFLLSSERTKFQGAGRLGAAHSPGTTIAESCFSTTSLTSLPVTIRPFDCVEDAQLSSLPDLLYCQLRARCKQDYDRFQYYDERVIMWSRLCDMLAEMKACRFFEPQCGVSMSLSDSILYHWDLETRNILVTRSSSGGPWHIDKVIDWDSVRVVPAVLARKPPVWLWDSSEDFNNSSLPSNYDGDVDLLQTSRYDSSSGRLSKEDQQIRTHFEQEMVRGLGDIYQGYSRDIYFDETYGNGRLIRRLARFAMEGVSRELDLKRFDLLSKDWSEFIIGRLQDLPIRE